MSVSCACTSKSMVCTPSFSSARNCVCTISSCLFVQLLFGKVNCITSSGCICHAARCMGKLPEPCWRLRSSMIFAQRCDCEIDRQQLCVTSMGSRLPLHTCQSVGELA